MPVTTRKSKLHVSQSRTSLAVSVAVSPGTIAAGSTDINIFVYQPRPPHVEGPFLAGEDYPSLVSVWDNSDDDIFDTL